ncbi:MAG: hypothetical protein MI866_02775 [Bacteroidales bacterium]|nr:hypothetical protein [Bacteroidales bacterium]
MAIASKGKGKAGGASVISYVLTLDEVIYLLSIYDKSEQDCISDDEINNVNIPQITPRYKLSLISVSS